MVRQRRLAGSRCAVEKRAAARLKADLRQLLDRPNLCKPLNQGRPNGARKDRFLRLRWLQHIAEISERCVVQPSRTHLAWSHPVATVLVAPALVPAPTARIVPFERVGDHSLIVLACLAAKIKGTIFVYVRSIVRKVW